MAAVCAEYYPSEADTQRFWSAEPLREKSSVGVPEGFPKSIESSFAWTQAEIENKRDEWVFKLTDEDIVAIEKALKEFEANNTELSSISAATFPLPESLTKRLRGVSDQLYDGTGFQIVHGLDPSKYSAKQNLIVYGGVNAHICPQRGFLDQQYESVITHIVNVQGGNGQAKPASTAPAFGNTPLSFHTDNCEIMAFYYIDTAPKGGETILTSSWQTYNELAKNRPEVLHTLADPWCLDTFKSYELHPPRHVRLLQRKDDGNVLLRFSRYGVTGWQRKRNPNLPAPTQAQLEALDAVQFTAMKNAITIPTGKGDLLFVNDMALMHARHGFDEEGNYLKRHIVKMYLRDPEKDWPIPPAMEEERARIYGPNREDGTKVETWHVFHEAGLEEDKRDNG